MSRVPLSDLEFARWEEAFWRSYDTPFKSILHRWLFTFWQWVTGRPSHSLVEQWREKFPRRCMICSYHRYGVSHGHIMPGTPVQEHDCIEGLV